MPLAFCLLIKYPYTVLLLIKRKPELMVFEASDNTNGTFLLAISFWFESLNVLYDVLFPYGHMTVK